MITTAKVLQLKPVRIINILKGNILSPTVMADKILLKTIKVTVGDCFVYMPKVIRLFFKPFPLPLIDVTDLIYRAVQVLRENLYWIRISARETGLMEPVELWDKG